MVYIAGDTHGLRDVDKLILFLADNAELSQNDIIIISGDCGVFFDPEHAEKYLAIYNSLGIKILFVDGNHENFDMLDALEISSAFGGRVHRLADNVYHLLRGEVYEIEGRTVFAFGGGTSIDRHMRKEGISWWARELPSDGECRNAKANLARYNNKVDYIVTHSAPKGALIGMQGSVSPAKLQVFYDNEVLSDFEGVDYKHWYFGHYHADMRLDERHTVLYREIIKLD